MALLYDFKCEECSHTFEGWTSLDRREDPQPCPRCEGDAYTIICAPRFDLEGVTGDFPTAADKWTRDHIKGQSRS